MSGWKIDSSASIFYALLIHFSLFLRRVPVKLCTFQNNTGCWQLSQEKKCARCSNNLETIIIILLLIQIVTPLQKIDALRIEVHSGHGNKCGKNTTISLYENCAPQRTRVRVVKNSFQCQKTSQADSKLSSMSSYLCVKNTLVVVYSHTQISFHATIDDHFRKF